MFVCECECVCVWRAGMGNGWWHIWPDHYNIHNMSNHKIVAIPTHTLHTHTLPRHDQRTDSPHSGRLPCPAHKFRKTYLRLVAALLSYRQKSNRVCLCVSPPKRKRKIYLIVTQAFSYLFFFVFDKLSILFPLYNKRMHSAR